MDIVEKLRAVDQMTGMCNAYYIEAADEIERLRTLLREARDTVKASTAESDITTARRDYRNDLFQRIDAALGGEGKDG